MLAHLTRLSPSFFSGDATSPIPIVSDEPVAAFFWNLWSELNLIVFPLSAPDGFLTPPLCPRPYTLEDGHQQLYLRNSRKNYYHHFLFLHFTFRILGKIGMVPFEVMCYLAVRFGPWIKLPELVVNQPFKSRGKLPRQLNLTAQSPIKHQSFLS